MLLENQQSARVCVYVMARWCTPLCASANTAPNFTQSKRISHANNKTIIIMLTAVKLNSHFGVNFLQNFSSHKISSHKNQNEFESPELFLFAIHWVGAATEENLHNQQVLSPPKWWLWHERGGASNKCRQTSSWVSKRQQNWWTNCSTAKHRLEIDAKWLLPMKNERNELKICFFFVATVCSTSLNYNW